MKPGVKIAAFALLFVALVLVTYIASQFPARLDFTSQKIYTLSPGTRALLGKVEEPITVQLVFSRSSDQVPVEFKNFATRVETMLRQFAAAAHGKVKLKIVDPRPDTDEETAARRSGLTPRNLPTGEGVFLGVIATQADQEKTIPWLEMNRESFLEYDVAKLIHGVQQFNKPRLGLISGLPLQNPGNPMMGQQGQDQFVVQEWENSFEIVPVEATATALPDKIDLLAVVHPQNLSEKLQFAIDQFLLGGKPVFVAVDPSSYIQKGQQRNQQSQMFGMSQQNTGSDLPKLFSAWGITFDAQNVIGDLELATPVNSGQGVMNYPVFISTRADNVSKTAMPTNGIAKMLFIEAGSVDVATDRGYEVTPLIQTSTRNSGVPAMMLAFTPFNDIARQVKDGGVKRNLAVMIHGKFKTAFPDGAPNEEKKPDSTDSPAETKPAETPTAGSAATTPAVKESATAGTLVVVGDTDWMMNEMALNQQYLRMGLAMPSNDNLAFAANTLEFLEGSSDLISIRSKGPVSRNFEVIHAMERVAQEKYQAEAQQLEQRLRDVQQEISKLMTGETEGKRLIATPEVSDAIAKYRNQEADVRTKLREIRRALREDVENLQNKLSVLLLLFVPVTLAVLGSVVLVRRNRRQRAA